MISLGNKNATINLRKGEQVSLTKHNPNLDKIHVGLGWDVNSQFTGNFDLDVSVFMLNDQGRVQDTKQFVYFHNLQSPEGSVLHTGDNLTGDGDGDDEVIKVQLSKVPAHVTKLVFAVTIYDAISKRQNFGQISNAFIRILDESTNREMINYNLTENYSSTTSIIAGEIYREGNEWRFNAKGEGLMEEIDGICRRYGVI